MKSTSKMMVIAAVLLIAAAALVMPASARAVVAGDTIFDYESGLDLTAIAANGDQLAKYTDDDTTKGQIFSFPVANAASLDLTQIDLNGNYGTYFVVSGGVATANRVYIRNPTVTFGAVLENDITSSISGKTVTKNTPIAFQFDATEVGTYLPTATVKVEVTTPGGGTITEIVDAAGVIQSLNNHVLNAPRTYIRNLDISQLEAGTYTAQAKWQTPTGFSDYATDSNSLSFTIASKEIAIESNKENVVRNNPFVVTVTGDSKKLYYLYIKDASVAAAKYPWIKAGQPSVYPNDATTATYLTYFDALTDQFLVIGTDAAATTLANNERDLFVTSTAAVIETNAGGTRSVEFGTDSTTDDKSFTIKVVDPDDSSKYDDVKVKVEEGEVTITAEGSGAYYLGEEVKLSGTDTDSDDVYLFMTGPNLGDDNGVSLDDTTAYASAGNYVHRSVESDDTWEYRWDTSAITGSTLDAGTYTIYACSNNVDDNGKNVDKSDLSGVKYQTFAVQLRSPYLSLNDVGNSVAKGDKVVVAGTAEGKPDNVQIWIFGKNYRDLAESASVEDDGSFEYTLERADTKNLANGQYYVVVQHPMTDGTFNVWALNPGTGGPYTITNDWSVTVVDLGSLAASDAATALIDMINSPNCDDTYRKVTFNLEEARIQINTIGDKYAGDKFTITGSTNLAVGDELTVNVLSSSFTATNKEDASSFSSDGGTAIVTEGTDGNTWSFDVDASDFKVDTYTVTVESIDADVSTSTTFMVLEGTPTTTTVPVTTTVATTTAATTAPATTTTTVNQPGFGALISLIGLGAVAFLVMRRN